MKSNYDILGNHVRLIDNRNRDLLTDKVLGINIDKFFMPSVANVIGTDLSKYKLLSKGNFACNPMHVGRDERLPVALYMDESPAIVSINCNAKSNIKAGPFPVIIFWSTTTLSPVVFAPVKYDSKPG